ncbi:MAG: ABC transporter ATP-binding protein [Eubacteriales bacterium]|nr:ABC transporter ATP-binding protein [Eubacteriales bacterium]
MDFAAGMVSLDNPLEIVLIILFDSTSPWLVALKVLYIAGVWKMLEKSGVKGWNALIPWVREYKLACCANREPEGRIYCLTDFGVTLFSVLAGVTGMMPETTGDTANMMMVLMTVVMLVEIIYAARIFSGLCEIYGRKKLWVLLWLTAPYEAIPALIWGFNKEYQPSWKVEDIKAEMARLATSGRAAAMDKGLTVNLEERSAWEFLHKNVLLRDIHMNIPQGHMVLLLGGSGAGKTTFVNAVNGYEKAKAEILLNGENLYTQYDKLKYDVGFVPQSDMVRGKDTVIATLMDAAKLRLPKDVSHKQRRDRVEEVMEIFGLTPVQDHLVEKLSGGQRKRLSISMEFISNPSLFILDEPDSGLDGVMARELFVQLRRIADSGKIVIAITHTPDRVIDLFDDVIILAKDSARTGRLAWYGSVEGARRFFGKNRMEEIVKAVNRKEEGGDGLADEYVTRFAEVQHG